MDFAYAFGECQLELSGSLSRASEQKAIGSAARFAGLTQFSSRSDFQASALRQEKCQDIQVRVGLDRIVDLKSRWERRAQQAPFLRHDRFVVGEQGSAEFPGELADRNAANPQLAIRTDKRIFDTAYQLHDRLEALTTTKRRIIYFST